MERLCANGHCTITWRYGVGPRGGRIRGGDRERAAAERLVDAGFANVVERGRYRADFGGTAYVILKGVGK